jgi:hypothetical protein
VRFGRGGGQEPVIRVDVRLVLLVTVKDSTGQLVDPLQNRLPHRYRG